MISAIQSGRKGMNQGCAEVVGEAGSHEWDAFVAGHPRGSVWHLSHWKRVQEATFRHLEGQFLVVRDPATGAIRSGLPIYSVRSWLLGNRMVSVPYAAYCDPLIGEEMDVEALWSFLIARMKSHHARWIELRLKGDCRGFDGTGVRQAGEFRWHSLTLDADPSRLKQKFHKTSVRQLIDKAARQGIAVDAASDEADWRQFYDLLVCDRRRLGLFTPPYELFRAMERLMAPKHVELLIARRLGALVGGLVALKCGNGYVVEYSAEKGSCRNLGVNQILYWTGLRRAWAAGIREFSLGRTSRKNAGLMRYKGRWGMKEESLSSLIYPSSLGPRFTQRGGRWISNAARVAARRLPLPAVSLLGRLASRHWA